MADGRATSGPQPAPFLHDVAEGPPEARAWWVDSADGTRLRLALWPEGEKGTVLLFPGRTEYVEKYGRLATDLAAAGYGMAAFDWRGQGMADRPRHRRDMGHVVSFDEYREDVAAFRAALAALGRTGPCWLIGHSMGGAIGLRALHDGLPVRAAAFTGPMWGIRMTPVLKSIAGIVMGLAGPLGFGTTFAPTTGPWQPMDFENNPLTTDRDQFDYMSRQVARHPELALGGPSILWVKAALEESRRLLAMPAPRVPAVTLFGSAEDIVEVPAIRARMADWPDGRLIEIEGGRHEVLMESPERRHLSLKTILAHFNSHA
ncbi:alpha/beta hydrolase [Roseibacterium sp. SDUM158017]|uniref:alpha/beta fold hydrolase n=1 Tax=Roseicyclus salinarum TaxID=3036773 RepID=UPI0024157CEC|nr:alpha/beta hydrolase [Roseibacterium sp. SDUM158017]MDG4649968.1 alpha/beta hydrolase [Roseibacterium sp. SDUM158017]